MALPYPNKTFLPFTILTAQELNEMHANTTSLANGTGLDDGAIKSQKIDFATFDEVWTEVAVGSGFTHSDGAYYMVRAGICFVRLRQVERVSGGGNATIITLPGDARPHFEINPIIQLDTGESLTNAWISTNGQLRANPPTGVGFKSLFSFPVDN